MPTDENDDALFEVEPGAEGARRLVAQGPVDKTFRAFDPGQDLLLPPSLDEWLPADHLARFVAELVDEHLDLSRIHAVYTEGRGAPPFDPRLMVRILRWRCARPRGWSAWAGSPSMAPSCGRTPHGARR